MGDLSDVKKYNVFSIFTDGGEVDGTSIGYPIGDDATGGSVVTLDSGNTILEFSRLGNDNGLIELKDEVIIADAFYSGVAATEVHFDVLFNIRGGAHKKVRGTPTKLKNLVFGAR